MDQQRIELHKAVREIEVLATALDMRAEELQLDGSLRSGLLYEVANAKAEVSEGIASLEAAKARGDRLEFELKEARLLLGKATTEVAELEGLLGRTEKELEEERGTRKSLEQVSCPPQPRGNKHFLHTTDFFSPHLFPSPHFFHPPLFLFPPF